MDQGSPGLVGPHMTAPDLTGQLLGNGKYRVVRLVGAGAMGVVYAADHVSLKRRVAIKVMNLRLISRANAAERFLREAQAASKIHHPHSVEVLDFGQEGDSFYIVMEFLDGSSLGALLRNHGPIEEGVVVHLLGQILGALARAHDHGVVHRDLKPDNVVVSHSRDDDGAHMLHAKVCDFGVAKFGLGASDTAAISQEGDIAGTPHFMAPEQAMGRHSDHRTDLYAVGVIAFQLLTGTLPFQAERPMAVLYKHIHHLPPLLRSVRPTATPAMEAWVAQALQKDPADRFADARTMRTALQQCMPPIRHGFELQPKPINPTASADIHLPTLDDVVRPRPSVTSAQPPTMTHHSVIASTESSNTGKSAWKMGIPGVAIGLAAAIAFGLAVWGGDSARPAPQGTDQRLQVPGTQAQPAAPPRVESFALAVSAAAVSAQSPTEPAAPTADAHAADTTAAPPVGNVQASAPTPPPVSADVAVAPPPDAAQGRGSAVATVGARAAGAHDSKGRKEAVVGTPEPATTAVVATVPAKVEPELHSPEPVQPVVEPVPAPQPPAEPIRTKLVVANLHHSGALSGVEVRHALANVVAQVFACLEDVGGDTVAIHKSHVTLTLRIDEHGYAVDVAGTGAQAPFVQCAEAAVRKVRARSAPDTGTVPVQFELRWDP